MRFLSLNNDKRALRNDPQHRSAHDDVNEAHFMQNNPGKTQDHLAALKPICGNLRCTEASNARLLISSNSSLITGATTIAVVPVVKQGAS